MSAKDYIPLNFALIGNPWNWLIIGLVATFVVLSARLIFPQSAPQEDN